MHTIFLYIAIILISTKLGGILSNKIKMPQVLGALIAGVLIGPSVFNLVQNSPSIKLLSDLGVLMLMFLAGLETDLEEFKKAGLSSFLIACGGIILPLIFGTLSAYAFFNNFYENLFIGVILTATSVSISVETLNELGKLNTRSGMNILGAAVIDDVLGLLVMSFVLALAQSANSKTGASFGATIGLVTLKVLIFTIGSLLIIKFVPSLYNKLSEKIGKKDLIVVISISLALIFGFLCEELGIAAITGAYVCGLMISPIENKKYISTKIHGISSCFLTPIFFAYVGISTNIGTMSSKIMILTILLLLTAILGKIIGCGITARLCGLTKNESIQVGMGMVSRGEVALITTSLGLDSGIITKQLYIPTLFVVITTTIVTPILLKFAFSLKDKKLKKVEQLQ